MVKKISPRKWLILPIETKSRELEAKLLLTCYALKAGYGVVLGSKGKVYQYMNQLPKGVVLLKSIQQATLKTLNNYLQHGYKLTSLDEEGIVHFNEERQVKSRFTEVTISKVDALFTWGQQEADIIQNAFPNYKNKIVITGNPRVDLWRPEHHCYYQVEANALQKQYGPYVLFCSNFSFNNHFISPEAVIEQLKVDAGITSPEDEMFYRGAIEYFAKIFQKFLEVLPKLAEAFPNHTLIIRPHPSENHKPWQNLSDRYENIKVIYQGAVTPWLLGSELVLHNGCTTGLEAFVMKKSVISYRPYTNETYDLVLPNTASTQVYSDDELLAVCQKYLVEKQTSDSNRQGKLEFVHPYIANLQGQLASEAIINELNKLEVEKSAFAVHSIAVFFRLFTGKIKFIIKKLLIKIPIFTRPILGEARLQAWSESAYGKQKFPDLTQSELQSLMGRMADLAGLDSQLKIQQIDKNVFCIY